MNFFQKLFKRGKPSYSYKVVSATPANFKQKTVYIVVEDSQQLHASMLCPCKCGNVINLNLLDDCDPYWSIKKHRSGSISISPSVWRTSGCRSHFFIRNGKLIWADRY